MYIVDHMTHKLKVESKNIIGKLRIYESLFRKNNDLDDNGLEKALNEYIIFHNNTKKYSTKYFPNEIRDISDNNLIEQIINNILISFKKHVLDKNEILDPDEKLLFWNNTICKNDI